QWAGPRTRLAAQRMGDHRGVSPWGSSAWARHTRSRMSTVDTSARVLAGGPVAEAILTDVARRAATLRDSGVTPALATILVGDDDASAGYIRIKQRQAAEVGFVSPHIHLPSSAGQADLFAAIDEFNSDPGVHGLLVQHPVPVNLDYDAAL